MENSRKTLKTAAKPGRNGKPIHTHERFSITLSAGILVRFVPSSHDRTSHPMCVALVAGFYAMRCAEEPERAPSGFWRCRKFGKMSCLRFRPGGPTNPMPVCVSHRSERTSRSQGPNGPTQAFRSSRFPCVGLSGLSPTKICIPGPSTPAEDVSALPGLSASARVELPAIYPERMLEFSRRSPTGAPPVTKLLRDESQRL